MRIAYLMHFFPGEVSGIWVKIRDQVDAWVNEGHDVRMFMLAAESGPTVSTTALPVQLTVAYHSSNVDQVRKLAKLRRSLDNWAPDVVYYRFDLFIPGLGRIARKYPTVVEVNTDDIGESASSTARRYFYNRLTRAWGLRSVSGAVFVSGETARRRHFEKPLSGKPVAVIGNGVQLSRYPLPVPPSNPEFRVVVLAGGVYAWLGVDKMLWLAGEVPQWRFDLIGISDTDLTNFQVPGNVIPHGLMPGEAYGPILERADLALSVLSLYKLGMNETSSLKMREYAAYGIPTVMGNGDPDFPDDCRLILRLPNTPDNVHAGLQRILDFAAAVKGQRIPRSEIRHLDTREKERKRLSLFATVLEDRR